MRNKLGFFAKLALLAILLFLVISIVDQNIEINRLNSEEEKLRAQQQVYTLRVEKLNAELEEDVTEETIKRIARRKLNLRDPGNLIYANDRPN